AECLKSCRKQTLKDIEIICVDDGSNDNSLSIIKKFAKKDKRIRYISKKNSGYGNTMNVGMDNATGEYIGIVESDDYVAKDMFETLYNKAKEYSLDVVKSDYCTFSTANGYKHSVYECTCPEITYYDRLIEPKKLKKIFSFQMNTWTGIYRTDFLRENNIRHNETPGASYQDNGFWFQTLALAKRVMFVNKAFYYYRQDNPNSSINSKSKVFCMNEEYKFIYDFINSNEEVKENFAEEYFIKKFFNYMHTYQRIAEEYKLTFLERFASEFRQSIESNELKLEKLKDNWVKMMCMRIVDNYKLFYYEDSIYSMEQRLNDATERLNRVRNSKEMIKGRKYTSKIKKILGRI
ncbi:MAG: glycosyltransferase, partial [Clostridia bacterium]|nr:glycosyltransferase [Clostridia bacterium]